MKAQEWTFTDKSKWPLRGPWDHEPDKAQWPDAATGLPCLAVRNRSHWCGYVGVTEGHPLFQKRGEDIDVEVHGGLTFSDFCQEDASGICHIVEPGEPERVWWLGFDCMHLGDWSPPVNQQLAEIEERYASVFLERGGYKDLEYVRQQCAALAGQLQAMA